MLCGAKRIWSLYLPWMTGVTPKLSTTPGPKTWPCSPLSMPRLCAFAEQSSLPLLTHRGCPSAQLRVPSLSREKPLPQHSSSQSLQLAEKDGHIRGRSKRFMKYPG